VDPVRSRSPHALDVVYGASGPTCCARGFSLSAFSFLILKERRGFKRARVLAGLGDDVTLHILRHTCATWMLQNRVSTREVAGYLGTSEKVVEKT
jgi:integrase